MKDLLVQWFADFPDWLSVILLSAIPVTELRVSLPLSLFYYDLSVWESVLYSILGNSLPIPIMFLLFPFCLCFAQHHIPKFSHFMHNYLRHLEIKHQAKYQRYGAFFLFLFVAVPLPGSGVWTGCLLAILFGMKPKFSIPAIWFGLVAACGIVLALALYATPF